MNRERLSHEQAGEDPAQVGTVQPAAPLPSAERSVLTLIRELQAGTLAGANLAITDRRRCVEHLSLEGASVPEIADILKVAERTVQRDRVAIKSANAVQTSPELLGETIGHLLRQAEVSVNRLRRIGREREAPAQARVEAERASFAIHREVVQTLQSVGYLPTAPTQVHGQILGSIQCGDGVPSGEELLRDTQRVARLLMDDPDGGGGGGGAGGGSGDADPKLREELKRVQDRCQRLVVAEQLRSVAERLPGSAAEAIELDAGSGSSSAPRENTEGSS